MLAFGLVACASSDDDNAAMDTTGPMGPTADEQLATLRGEIAELRKQLGIEDDDDLGDSISDLQDKVADLKGQVEDQENAAAAAAAKAHAAKLNKLAMGIGEVTDASWTLMFRPFPPNWVRRRTATLPMPSAVGPVHRTASQL